MELLSNVTGPSILEQASSQRTKGRGMQMLMRAQRRGGTSSPGLFDPSRKAPVTLNERWARSALARFQICDVLLLDTTYHTFHCDKLVGRWLPRERQ
jgi:hypothetical protein